MILERKERNVLCIKYSTIETRPSHGYLAEKETRYNQYGQIRLFQ